MNQGIHVQSHIGADGTLHIEGLHHMADQDVLVVLTPKRPHILRHLWL